MSGGLGGTSAVLRELGPVSRAAALAGVAATAAIPAGSAVTFRFEVQAGGPYTLLVRHDGAGLSLAAETPAGATPIDPGTAGPFHAVPLTLKPGAYEVTAAARGGRPVFVDWELLLNSGVGQAAASSPGAILPLAAPASSGGTAAVGTPLAGPGGVGPGAAPMAATGAPEPVALEVAPSPSRLLVGGLMGRNVGDPDGSPPVVAAAPALGRGPAELSMAELETALLIGLQPGAGAAGPGVADPARVEPSWFAELTRVMAGEAPVAAAGAPGPIEVDPALLSALTPDAAPAEEGASSLAAIHPGVMVGAVAVTIASRRIIKRRRDGLGLALEDKGRPRAIRARPDRSLDLT